jgi:hypothetical protein
MADWKEVSPGVGEFQSAGYTAKVYARRVFEFCPELWIGNKLIWAGHMYLAKDDAMNACENELRDAIRQDIRIKSEMRQK